MTRRCKLAAMRDVPSETNPIDCGKKRRPLASWSMMFLGCHHDGSVKMTRFSYFRRPPYGWLSDITQHLGFPGETRSPLRIPIVRPQNIVRGWWGDADGLFSTSLSHHASGVHVLAMYLPSDQKHDFMKNKSKMNIFAKFTNITRNSLNMSFFSKH